MAPRILVGAEGAEHHDVSHEDDEQRTREHRQLAFERAFEAQQVGRVIRQRDERGVERHGGHLLLVAEVGHDADGAHVSPRWIHTLQAELHAAARATAPDLTVVLTGACWGQANALASLDPKQTDDDAVLWTFHSYAPFLFSHQGAIWSSAPEKYIWDLPYPPSAVTDEIAAEVAAAAKERMAAAEGQADEALIDEAIAAYRAEPDSIVTTEIERATAWADEHGIPRDRLFLGEFGALHTVKDQSLPRDWYLAFIADKRQAAEAAGMSWAVYDYKSDMGIADDDAPDHRLDPDTCRALGLPCDQ